MGRRPKPQIEFDRELADLPAPVRWREFMGRIEAVIFASSGPVARETLAGLVGRDCSLDLLIEDIREELRARPYELVAGAGGFELRTKRRYADVLRACLAKPYLELSRAEALALTAIAYFQPVTRAQLADILGKAVSRDTIAALRRAELIAAGPRSPTPGAPHTYVTTPAFLALYGFESLRDLPDMEKLEEAGLLSTAPLPDDIRRALGLEADDAEEDDLGVETQEESTTE